MQNGLRRGDRMTETKRFYYNTFYHKDDMSRVLEYEIIDRQSYPNYPNHDEKEDIPDWYIYIGENDSGWQDMLITSLNQLNDENEQLKQFKEKVFNLINTKIEECEKDYNRAVKSGMPSSIIYDEIESLEWLKKELKE